MPPTLSKLTPEMDYRL